MVMTFTRVTLTEKTDRREKKGDGIKLWRKESKEIQIIILELTLLFPNTRSRISIESNRKPPTCAYRELKQKKNMNVRDAKRVVPPK